MENDNIFGEQIFGYSRKQAISDGVLVDFNIGDLAPITKRYWKFPFVSTIAVFEIMEKAVEGGSDWSGIIHDIFMMSKAGRIEKLSVGENCHFKVKIGSRLHEMYINIGPGDDPRPVMTLMLRGED